MNIEFYINELIYKNECVIIPGFGGFLSTYKPATFYAGKETISPPSKSISFNNQLVNNDGLLINHVSQREGLIYNDALKIVEGFVSDINTKLQNSEKVVFEGIGAFEFDNEKNLQFSPIEYINYNADSFGLKDVQILPLSGKNIEEKITKRFKNRQSQKLISRKLIRRIAIAVPIVAAMILIPSQTNLLKNASKAAISLFNSNMSRELVEIEKINTVSLVSLSEEFSPRMELRDEIKQEIVLPDVKKYYVIAASFDNELQAERLVSRLKKQSYPSKVLQPENGRYRVVYDGRVNKSEGVALLETLRKKTGNQSLWLLRR